MKNIKVIEWEETFEDKPVKASTINILSAVINEALNKDKLAGFDNFRKLQRIARAIDERKDKKVIAFDDEDFTFVKGLIEKYIPAGWALNKKIGPAVNEIMDIK